MMFELTYIIYSEFSLSIVSLNYNFGKRLTKNTLVYNITNERKGRQLLRNFASSNLSVYLTPMRCAIKTTKIS